MVVAAGNALPLPISSIQQSANDASGGDMAHADDVPIPHALLGYLTASDAASPAHSPASMALVFLLLLHHRFPAWRAWGMIHLVWKRANWSLCGMCDVAPFCATTCGRPAILPFKVSCTPLEGDGGGLTANPILAPPPPSPSPIFRHVWEQRRRWRRCGVHCSQDVHPLRGRN